MFKTLPGRQARIISALAPCHYHSGIMGYWNTGIMMPLHKTNIPTFQDSKDATACKSFRYENPWRSAITFLDKKDSG
jgi:hypothetical protein